MSVPTKVMSGLSKSKNSPTERIISSGFLSLRDSTRTSTLEDSYKKTVITYLFREYETIKDGGSMVKL
jgi:hypothetical protein